MRSRIFKTGWKILDVLFPPCCAGCGEWGTRYCRSCIENTKTIKTAICQICGEPLNIEKGSVCDRCRETETYFSAVRSWGLFEDPLKEAIHQLKYRRNVGLGEVLAQPLVEILFAEAWDIDLVTSVPLSQKRREERGFNQSDLLARPIGWIAGVPFKAEAVTRCRETKSQVGLSRTERKQNMVDAFSSHPDMVSGRNVLVVDDVITTGATLNFCSKAIIDSGAKYVYGLTLARSAQL